MCESDLTPADMPRRVAAVEFQCEDWLQLGRCLGLFCLVFWGLLLALQVRNPYSYYWIGAPLQRPASAAQPSAAVHKLVSYEQLLTSGRKASLCVSLIASHRREGQGYLIHTMNSLVAARSAALAEAEVFYNVLDAELCKSNEHADVLSASTPVTVFRPPVYRTFDWTAHEARPADDLVNISLNRDLAAARDNVAHLSQAECRSAFRLQTLDYAYTLLANAQWCHYTLAIEDDVLAASGWDVKSLATAYELEARDEKWLSAKLYYPSNWGASDAPFIVCLAGHAGLLAGLVLRFSFLRRGRGTMGACSAAHLCCVLAVGFVVFVGLRLSSKQVLFPLPSGLSLIRNGMVTSAFLFNNRHIDGVVRYWQRTANDGEAKDTAYNHYLALTEAAAYTTYMRVPHLFQHIGYFSATQHPISEGEFRTRKMSNVFDGPFVL